MRNKKRNVSMLLVVLVLLAGASSLFLGCDNIGNLSDTNDSLNKKETITGTKGTKMVITELNKNTLSMHISFYSNDLRKTINAKGTFSKDFSVIALSNIKPNEVIDSIGSKILQITNGNINLLSEDFNLNSIINKFKNGAEDNSIINNIILDFDESEISCKKNTDDSIIKNGSKVEEGLELWFHAKNTFPDGKVLDKWIIGKQEKSNLPSPYWCFYRVSKKDIDSTNKIHIAYILRNPSKFKIIFNDNKVRCLHCADGGNCKELKSNSEVYEGSYLNFGTKNISENKVATWKINDMYLDGDFNKLYYCVKPKDANTSNEIHLIYGERDKESFTIKFDEKIIKCANKKTNEIVISGSKILEGVMLKFETISGKPIIWSIGKGYYPGARNEIRFEVAKGAADNKGIIKVGVYKE